MSFPKYPAYKDSGVEWIGEIPVGWKCCRLRFVAQFNPSKSEISYIPLNEEVSFLPMEAIGDDGAINLEQKRKISDVQNGYTYFRDMDVVFAKITPCFENGKGALVKGLLRGIGFGTTELIVARATQSRVIPEYLLSFFQSDIFRKPAEASMYGAGGQKRVSEPFVRDFSIPLPPLPEQQAIANFLDRECGKIDALIAEQERLIALLAEKRQAVISHAVTKGLNPNAPMKDSGIPWIGMVPEGWDIAALKRYWAVIDCKHLTAEFVDDGIPIVSIREVQSRYVTLGTAKQTTSRFYEQLIEGGRKPCAGDLIFSRNATVGEVSQVSDRHPDFAMGQDVCLMKKMDEDYSTDYFQDVICSFVVVEQLKNFMVGSTFRRVNVEEIKALIVPMPSADEQFSIARFLGNESDKIDLLKADVNGAITILKERRAALISAAVTGKIDVRAQSKAVAA